MSVAEHFGFGKVVYFFPQKLQCINTHEVCLSESSVNRLRSDAQICLRSCVFLLSVNAVCSVCKKTKQKGLFVLIKCFCFILSVFDINA